MQWRRFIRILADLLAMCLLLPAGTTIMRNTFHDLLTPCSSIWKCYRPDTLTQAICVTKTPGWSMRVEEQKNGEQKQSSKQYSQELHTLTGTKQDLHGPQS